MKKYKFLPALVAAALFLAVVYLTFLYYESDMSDEAIMVRVRPGDSFSDIQEELYERGVLKHPAIFRWAAYLQRKEGRVRVGEYRFMKGESAAAILARLTGGAVEYRKIVIPEGLMLTEIAAVTAEETGIDSALFVDLATDGEMVDSLGFSAGNLEGYLFPDTYLASWPFSARGLIAQMVRRFREVYAEEAEAAADSAGMTRRETVTLASIIQAEARGTEEMPKISAVYHNRLDRGMRLEADPTVAYALGGVRRRLWFKDLRVDSPYNTYRYSGLPPGPICSPGREALRAAVYPEPGFEAYYFVADGTGGHIFSRTLRQHNRAKRMIRSGPGPAESGTEDRYE
jgi:UPF0755 protein